MTRTEHPNIALLTRFNPADPAGAAELLADDFVMHYFNPRLPDLEGDYVGAAGLQAFFEKIGEKTRGTFRVQPISATPVGDELVVVHTKNRMVFEGQPVETDVVTVWRVVAGRIAEFWDIPSVYTGAAADGTEVLQAET